MSRYYSGEPLEEVLRLWADEEVKLYSHNPAEMLPIEMVLPHREYHWSRDNHRDGAVPDRCYPEGGEYDRDLKYTSHKGWMRYTQTVDGRRIDNGLAPKDKVLRWDKLVEYMKRCGWTPYDPAHMLFGANGEMKLGEGNHRVAVAKEIGLKVVPVRFHFDRQVRWSKHSHKNSGLYGVVERRHLWDR